MSTPSTLVADRYRLVKLLGAGGMGVVWHAWDERLERHVALKMLRTLPELTDQEREVATNRAMREARITAGLHHPHAVTVYDVVEHEGRPCLVMQLIESTPLSILLREHGTLTPAEAARIGAQVSSALAAAHKMRIVHRDVKPGNILITEDGSAKISDFGISHALGDATITATGLIHGTPAYLAPEVARGRPSSFAADVFSLGSTLYAMVEGDPPFGAEPNAIALLHKVARGAYPRPKRAGVLAPLLRTMLSADPKRRPTMTAIAASLSEVQGPSPTKKRPVRAAALTQSGTLLDATTAPLAADNEPISAGEPPKLKPPDQRTPISATQEVAVPVVDEPVSTAVTAVAADPDGNEPTPIAVTAVAADPDGNEPAPTAETAPLTDIAQDELATVAEAPAAADTLDDVPTATAETSAVAAAVVTVPASAGATPGVAYAADDEPGVAAENRNVAASAITEPASPTESDVTDAGADEAASTAQNADVVAADDSPPTAENPDVAASAVSEPVTGEVEGLSDAEDDEPGSTTETPDVPATTAHGSAAAAIALPVAATAVTEQLTEPFATPGDEDAADEAVEPPDRIAETAAFTATDHINEPTLQAPVGRTVPMDQPTRFEPPTAETEPLAKAASAAAIAPQVIPRRPPLPAALETQPAPPRRRRTGAVVGIVLVAAALVVATVLLFNPFRFNPGVAAAPTPSATLEPSRTPTPQTSTPAPTPTPSPTPTVSTPSPPPVVEEPPALTSEERVVQTITDYYALVTVDRDSAWTAMTADYQENHAGGRGAYEAFWAPIAEVQVSDVVAYAPDQGQATLTYYYSDGSVVQEVTAFYLVDESGVLKIAASEVL